MPSSAAPIFVIFGASGDLTALKLIPALFRLHRKGRLPAGTAVLGVARSPLTDDAFREKLRARIDDAGDGGGDGGDDDWNAFAQHIGYQRADATRADDLGRVEKRLTAIEAAAGGDGGRIYYLSIAPPLYGPVIERLGETGMASEDRGWRRVVIEKPFGTDRASAQALNRTVHAVFREPQVFRIDHYLGKETVQNLLVFRFANTIFEPIWNRNFIDHVQITVAESVVVGNRGPYYDRAGVLRDMFQNHLMQLLALVAMEAPSRFEAEALRNEKVKLLDSIRPLQGAALAERICRGQYDGYRDERGVAADSRTATYAAVRWDIDNERWRGVPFYLRSGKSLAHRVTEVMIEFRRPPHLLFDPAQGGGSSPNRIALGIQPHEGVHLNFQSKVPDGGMSLQGSDLHFHFGDRPGGAEPPDAYEVLLCDALEGDAALFMRSDEIEKAWEIVDPIVAAADAGDLPDPESYPPGSWGPPGADAFIGRDGRRWVLDTLHHLDPQTPV